MLGQIFFNHSVKITTMSQNLGMLVKITFVSYLLVEKLDKNERTTTLF